MTSAKKLKLGWLVPYSGTFRQIRSDLQNGFSIAFEKESHDVLFESFSEFIYSGSAKETEDALRKLLQYQDVDFILGVTGSKTATQIIPLLESRQKPAFLLNLGADTPSRQLSSDYLFYNSLHLWKSEWAMGKWAQQQFGGTPSINLSVYEGGYSLQEPFRLGTAAAGAAAVQLNIDKNITGPPDTLPLIQYLQEQSPAHAHTLLSGKDGDQFIQLFGKSGLNSKMALSVNPFMVEDGLWKQDVSGLDLYNASTWSLALENSENSYFTARYLHTYGIPPNAFSLLAYEAGLVLSSAIAETGSLDPEVLRHACGKLKPIGPRGPLQVSTRPLQTSMPVYIRKPENDPVSGLPLNKIIATTEGIEWDTPNFVTEQTLLTGWQNPYLCV